MRPVFCFLIGLLFLWGCGEEHSPKPKAYLALSFPPSHYKTVKNCDYEFEINKIARVKQPFSDRPCMINIDYPELKGTIYISYNTVDNNLEELIKDAEKLPLEHTVKADEIIGDEYENPRHSTYGMLYTVTGNAASQGQFYVTDSVSHFMTGSIYFDRRPNYDSIYPAAEYLKNDMKKLIESLQWKSKNVEAH